MCLSLINPVYQIKAIKNVIRLYTFETEYVQTNQSFSSSRSITESKSWLRSSFLLSFNQISFHPLPESIRNLDLRFKRREMQSPSREAVLRNAKLSPNFDTFKFVLFEMVYIWLILNASIFTSSCYLNQSSDCSEIGEGVKNLNPTINHFDLILWSSIWPLLLK